MTECTHLDQIRVLRARSEGCEDCLAAGDEWVHLRLCMGCGKVGCCDSSKNRHASAHARESGHAIEAGEAWRWCYVDEVAL